MPHCDGNHFGRINNTIHGVKLKKIIYNLKLPQIFRTDAMLAGSSILSPDYQAALIIYTFRQL